MEEHDKKVIQGLNAVIAFLIVFVSIMIISVILKN